MIVFALAKNTIHKFRLVCRDFSYTKAYNGIPEPDNNAYQPGTVQEFV